jgi:FkbM family methyltransferase
MVNENLIFDIGFHRGEDLQYFLHLGFNVIGMDADPSLVELAKETFASQYKSGQLRVFNYAISGENDTTVEFNVSEWTLWNSLRKEIAGRDNKAMETIAVKTRRLDTLMKEHGVPFYCKIDIEGYDSTAVDTLKDSEYRPVYMSVETECIGDSEIIGDAEALETLGSLHSLGYNKFKLVDQKTLEVLSMAPFYGVKKPPLTSRRSLADKVLGRNKVPTRIIRCFERMRTKHSFNFPPSTTGPFGDQLEGNWVDFETGKEMLLFHRKAFFAQKGVSNYAFWCDWHATRK